MSSTSKAQNIVLQIQLPKKSLEAANGDIQKALLISKKNDIVLNPEYIIETTYRFRGKDHYYNLHHVLTDLELCDYQYNTRSSEFIEKVKSTLFSHNCKLFEIRSFIFFKQPNETKNPNK